MKYSGTARRGRAALYICAAIAPLAVHAAETTTFTYDAQGRIAGAARSGSVNNGTTTTIGYDSASNRTSYVISSGRSAPTLAIAPSNALEGAALDFVVTRSGDTSLETAVNWSTLNGTALVGSDYAASSGTLNFAAGETSKAISVSTLDDNVLENAKTMTVTLSGATGLATITTANAVGTITDNDSALAIAGSTVTEGGTLAFAVTRTGYTGGWTGVNFASSDGTASAPGDYTAVLASVGFGAGETSKTILVTTIDDSLVESQEILGISLSGASPNTVISTATATGVINDNDVAPAYLAISSASSLEGGSLAFIVSRTGNADIPASASFVTTNGSAIAGSDYAAAQGLVSFVPGETSKTITVNTLDDGEIEPSKALYVSLSAPAANTIISGGTGIGTINDNDSAFSISGASANEGGVLSFVVTRTGYTGNTSTVNFATVNGSAGWANFTPTSGTLSFAPGATSQTISVATQSDQTWTGNLGLNVNLSAPTGGASIGTSAAIGTIVNTDEKPVLSVSSVAADEGKNLTFIVTRAGAPGNTVSANYATQNGSAVAGVNYTAASGTVWFNANMTSQWIVLPTVRDGAVTGNLTMNLALSSPSAEAVLGASSATGTINNIDAATPVAFNPRISVPSSSTTTVPLSSLGSVVGQGLTISSFSPANGVASIAADGQSVTYTAPYVGQPAVCSPAVTLTVTAGYTITATSGASANGTVTFAVKGPAGGKPKPPAVCD